MSICRLLALIFAVLVLMGAPGLAQAVPELQVYLEGATYDTASETWTIAADTVKLWVIADISSKGTIFDVKLVAAYASGLTGSLSIAPAMATAGLLPAPGDPALPAIPTLVPSPSSAVGSSGPCGANGTNGTLPCMGDGGKLAGHGEYGTGVQWIQWALGDFSLTDSPIGDYNGAPPTTFPGLGQINAYEITASGFPAGTPIHFDAFDHIEGKQSARYVFAPFSHDAEVLDKPVPQPLGLLLVTLGAGGLGGARLLRRR